MISIERIYQEDVTVGILRYCEFRCFTLEPPWKFNKINESCIPAGHYRIRKHYSPTFGDCFLIDNVPHRTWILIHAGNYVENTQGCILLGEYVKDINGDGIPDVANSQATLDKFLEIVKYDNLPLIIR